MYKHIYKKYIHIYIYVYAYICIYTNIYIHIYMYIYIYIYMNVYIHIFIVECSCIHMCVYVYIHTYIYMYTSKRITHAYIRMYITIQTHIYVFMCTLLIPPTIPDFNSRAFIRSISLITFISRKNIPLWSSDLPTVKVKIVPLQSVESRYYKYTVIVSAVRSRLCRLSSDGTLFTQKMKYQFFRGPGAWLPGFESGWGCEGFPPTTNTFFSQFVVRFFFTTRGGAPRV
jgi:hypothetical protein